MIAPGGHWGNTKNMDKCSRYQSHGITQRNQLNANNLLLKFAKCKIICIFHCVIDFINWCLLKIEYLKITFLAVCHLLQAPVTYEILAWLTALENIVWDVWISNILFSSERVKWVRCFSQQFSLGYLTRNMKSTMKYHDNGKSMENNDLHQGWSAKLPFINLSVKSFMAPGFLILWKLLC